MEFPLTGLIEMNGSGMAAGQGGSLYSRKPVVAVPYVGVLCVAAVVGTFGNLVVVITVIVPWFRSRRQRARNTGNDAGRAFIANLALSDMIVTAVINPLAVVGMYRPTACFLQRVSIAFYAERRISYDRFRPSVCLSQSGIRSKCLTLR